MKRKNECTLETMRLDVGVYGSTSVNDKKSFAKEINEKNKEIREQYKIIVQETFTKSAPDSPKKHSKKSKS